MDAGIPRDGREQPLPVHVAVHHGGFAADIHHGDARRRRHGGGPRDDGLPDRCGELPPAGRPHHRCCQQAAPDARRNDRVLSRHARLQLAAFRAGHLCAALPARLHLRARDDGCGGDGCARAAGLAQGRGHRLLRALDEPRDGRRPAHRPRAHRQFRQHSAVCLFDGARGADLPCGQCAPAAR